MSAKIDAILLLSLSAFVLINFVPNFTDAKTPRRQLAPHQYKIKDFGDGNAQKFRGTGCSFYCFFTPERKEMIKLDFYLKLACSHLVYGWARVEDHRLETPTANDLIPYKYYGNFKIITGLRESPLSMKVLLGMQQAEGTKFLSDPEMSRNVSNRMVFYTRRYGFDGMFLKFHDSELLTPGFERFVGILNEALDKDAERYKKHRRLSLVLSISAEWAPHVYRRMPKLDAHFEAFYLWSNATKIANAEPLRKTPALDALLPSASVERAETISENAEKLAASGVSRQKIIIGLSAFAQKYTLGSDQVPISGAEPVPYQQMCKVFGFGPSTIAFDKNASALSFSGEKDHWYALNQPDHEALVQKIKWINENEFGGVGVYSLQADDLGDACGKGIMPLHRSIARHFVCVPPVDKNRGNALGRACTRMCQLNLDRANAFNFDDLQPDWCSHLILSSAIIQRQDVEPTPGLKRAIKAFNNWTTEHKPFLILSIGGPDQGSEIWRSMVIGSLKRMIFVESIRKLVVETGANGVEINWTHGRMSLIDQLWFSYLAKDLRRALPSGRQIIVSLSPDNLYKQTYDNPYDFGTLVDFVDYFVAQGFSFHRPSNPHTGHHSPLFSNHELLTDPRMTIEGMTSDLLGQKVPAEKIVVALSAQAMSMSFGIDNMRISERNIGDLAATHSSASYNYNHRVYSKESRSLGSGAATQTEVCRILAKNVSVEERFIEPLAVPYLINDREFIAYDNVRSIQIKTVWVSMQNFGGIALYDLEADDVAGECPQGRPFRLLSTIAEAQMCNLCNATVGFSANMTVEQLPDDVESEHSHLNSSMGPVVSLEKEAKCAKTEDFIVSCSFRLPKTNSESFLTPKALPFGQCDEVVIEEVVLNGTDENGILEVHGGNAALGLIKDIVEQVSQSGVKSMLVAIGCGRNVKDTFADLINDDNRAQLVDAIQAFVQKHNFTGVQLKQCDHLVTNVTRDDFAAFIIDLRTAFLAAEEEGACAKSISMRIPVWHTNLTANYDVKVLNSLQHVVLEGSHMTSPNQTLLLNPLYAEDLSKDADLHVQDTTLHAWIASGLNPDRVIMQIPAYGIQQVTSDSTIAKSAKPGDATAQRKIHIISQTEVCKQLHEPQCVTHTMFDLLTGYAVSAHQWVSYESKETVGYKMKYALKQRLGGVSLHALNDDDSEGGCKSGEYPLLAEITKARCHRENAAKSTGEKVP